MGIGTDVVVFRRRRYDMMMIDHHKSHGSNVYRYVLGDCEIVSSWTFSFSQPPPSCDWSLSHAHSSMVGCVWTMMSCARALLILFGMISWDENCRSLYSDIQYLFNIAYASRIMIHAGWVSKVTRQLHNRMFSYRYYRDTISISIQTPSHDHVVPRFKKSVHGVHAVIIHSYSEAIIVMTGLGLTCTYFVNCIYPLSVSVPRHDLISIPTT